MLVVDIEIAATAPIMSRGGRPPVRMGWGEPAGGMTVMDTQSDACTVAWQSFQATRKSMLTEDDNTMKHNEIIGKHKKAVSMWDRLRGNMDTALDPSALGSSIQGVQDSRMASILTEGSHVSDRDDTAKSSKRMTKEIYLSMRSLIDEDSNQSLQEKTTKQRASLRELRTHAHKRERLVHKKPMSYPHKERSKWKHKTGRLSAQTSHRLPPQKDTWVASTDVEKYKWKALERKTNTKIYDAPNSQKCSKAS